MLYGLHIELQYKNRDRNNSHFQDASYFCRREEGNWDGDLHLHLYCSIALKRKKKVPVANNKETICLLWVYVCLLQCALCL